MKILISAAEASSDMHGAELLKALRAQAPSGTRIDAFGIGGPKLRAEGLRTVVDARDLLAMGFTEVLVRLPRILRGLGRVSKAVQEERPDVAILIDYPDFHFRLARRLKRLRIPAVYYIPPKVWVWRAKRVRFLKRFFDLILCILPFEEEFYSRFGVPVRYVGNPVLDELPLGLSRAGAREALGYGASEKILALLPGSRPGELKRHFGLFLSAAQDAAAKLGADVHALIPLPGTAEIGVWEQRLAQWVAANPESRLKPKVFAGRSWECMRAADAGLIKSGTSTLEAALLGCPHAVVYRPAGMTAFIFKYLVRYRGPVGLVNLVGGWKAGDRYFFEEWLMDRATRANLASEAAQLLSGQGRSADLVKACADLRRRMGERGPSARAAEAILERWAATP